MFVASDGLPAPRTFSLVVLAMVFARTAARHTLVSRKSALTVCIVSAGLFVATTAWINPLCLALSPVALILIFGYSLTKRFTSGAQFFLGLALSAAPVGAWLAVTGSFAPPPFALAFAVLCWVAGFDMIYATQDYEIDRREGLHSMVVLLGIPGALSAAQGLHVLALGGFAAFGVLARLGPIYHASLVFVAGAMFYEHLLARRGEVGAINKAFFQANAAVSLVFVLSTLADRLSN